MFEVETQILTHHIELMWDLWRKAEPYLCFLPRTEKPVSAQFSAVIDSIECVRDRLKREDREIEARRGCNCTANSHTRHSPDCQEWRRARAVQYGV